jgi:hypothetical protein
MRVDHGGSTQLFEQPTPVATRQQTTRITAALGNRRRIDATLFAVTVVLHTFHALIAT